MVTDIINTLHIGDCRNILPTLEAKSVQCVVTSPPYYKLRDYGAKEQIGQEDTVEEYVKNLVAVFPWDCILFRPCRKPSRIRNDRLFLA